MVLSCCLGGGINTDVLSPSNTKPTEEKYERWEVRKRVSRSMTFRKQSNYIPI